MAGFGNIVQKAFYLGVGLASYAGEKAGSRLQELRKQAQLLADEMVKRGEMTTEEASKFVEQMINEAQWPSVESEQENTTKEPRKIEILSEDDEEEAEEQTKEKTNASSSSGSEAAGKEESSTQGDDNINHLRDRVKELQEELKQLGKE